MDIKKVWIEDGCTSCGLCESISPEVFYIEDEAIVIEGAVFAGNEDNIIEAADSCPVEVIKYE